MSLINKILCVFLPTTVIGVCTGIVVGWSNSPLLGNLMPIFITAFLSGITGALSMNYFRSHRYKIEGELESKSGFIPDFLLLITFSILMLGITSGIYLGLFTKNTDYFGWEREKIQRYSRATEIDSSIIARIVMLPSLDFNISDSKDSLTPIISDSAYKHGSSYQSTNRGNSMKDGIGLQAGQNSLDSNIHKILWEADFSDEEKLEKLSNTKLRESVSMAKKLQFYRQDSIIDSAIVELFKTIIRK